MITNSTFDPSEPQSAYTRLTNCLSDIRDWMAAKLLKLSDCKNELVIMGNPKRLSEIQDFRLSIGNVRVKPVPVPAT